MIVAIDGPAGSGKSTTARRVAERLGWLYLDTGAMYRAAALAFMRAKVDPTEEEAARLMPGLSIDVHVESGETRVALDGADVTDAIRSPDVSEAASRVSSLRPVRERLVAEQRRVAKTARGGVVVEGRDIGTVVFPHADVKVFLVASVQERAARRHAELLARGENASIAEVRDEIELRDGRDSGRDLAPLRKADDAAVIDTTGLSIDQQVERVVGLLKARQGEHAGTHAGT